MHKTQQNAFFYACFALHLYDMLPVIPPTCAKPLYFSSPLLLDTFLCLPFFIPIHVHVGCMLDLFYIFSCVHLYRHLSDLVYTCMHLKHDVVLQECSIPALSLLLSPFMRLRYLLQCSSILKWFTSSVFHLQLENFIKWAWTLCALPGSNTDFPCNTISQWYIIGRRVGIVIRKKSLVFLGVLCRKPSHFTLS